MVIAQPETLFTEIIDFLASTPTPEDIIAFKPSSDLLYHSDHGSQYTSAAYQQRLIDHGMTLSMNRTGDCLDNAPMESFWATLKRECADASFATHAVAWSEVFAYIMGFYNRQRRHSALGYVSLMAFEQQSEKICTRH